MRPWGHGRGLVTRSGRGHVGVASRPLGRGGAGRGTHSGAACPPRPACRSTIGPRRCHHCCSTCGPTRCAGRYTTHLRNTLRVRKTGSHSPESTKVSLFTTPPTILPGTQTTHAPGLLPCLLSEPYILYGKTSPGCPCPSVPPLPPLCSPRSFLPSSLSPSSTLPFSLPSCIQRTATRRIFTSPI